MNESDKYYCAECKKELDVSFNRFLQMVDESYHVKVKNNKLLKFVKELADESVYEKYENENHISWAATELLQEIKEL